MSGERVDVLAVMARELEFVRTVRNDPEANEAAYFAGVAVAELIAERDRLRKELAWSTPVGWVLRTYDPDPQYDFELVSECPSGWVGKAFPLYDRAGMRPINWEKAVAGLIEALKIMTMCAYPVSTDIDPRGHNWCIARLDEALPIATAALSRIQPDGQGE